MNALVGRKIVLLPGIDGTGLSFGPFCSALPPGVGIQVIRYPNAFLDFPQTVECARAQIEADSRTIVIAESFSGPVAVALLGSGKIAPACLVLCATFARSPRPLLIKGLLRLPLDRLIRLPFPHLLFSRIVEGGEASAGVFADLWDKVKNVVPAEILVHRLRLIDRVDVRSWLPQLKIPCCYIQASGDLTVPASNLFDFTDAVPGMRVRRIKGPHFILQANPLACLAAIEEFINSIE